MTDLDGLVDVIPREAIEAAASELAEQAKANAEKGYLWALAMGDRYAAEAVLRAAEPFLRRAWVLGVLHDPEAIERMTEILHPFGSEIARAALRAALGVGEEQA